MHAHVISIMRSTHAAFHLRRVAVHLVSLLAALVAFRSELGAQTIVTSPPPAELVFIPNPRGFTLSKHPTLPVLYVGCYIAAESRNLATYPLNPDGTVNTNGMRALDYFSGNSTDSRDRYQIMRPIVLPKEKILYLACTPGYPQFFDNTNHQQIAAVALDDQGQPGKILKAFRTTHDEKEVCGWQFDATTRRIYISYHAYFGWIGLDKNGLPVSDQFTYIPNLVNFWHWVYVPEWQRFFARQTGTSIAIFALNGGANATIFLQNIQVPYSSYGNLQVCPNHHRLYSLDIAPNAQLALYKLTEDGRYTGIPRYFPMGDAIGMRINFKTNHLYAWNATAVMQIYALDEQGVPRGPPQISALRCGTILDMLFDESSVLYTP